MAVSRRLNGMMDGDDNEDGNPLFEEEGGYVDFDSDIPVHLRGLAYSSQLGDVDTLRLAIANLEGSIDEPVEDGDTALHLACLYGHFSCVQLLLESGAGLEPKDEDGAIPLHDACAGGYTEIVQLLINSADNVQCVKRMLETADFEGDTPLHHAARGEHVDVIRLLLDHGASPTTTNACGKKPFELADVDSEARRILEVATISALRH